MNSPSHRRAVRSRYGRLFCVLIAASIPPGTVSAQQPSVPKEGTPGIFASATSAPTTNGKNSVASDAYLAGARAIERNDLSAAQTHFLRAAALAPDNADYAMAVRIARQHQLTGLVQQAADARLHGKAVEAELLLNQARSIDPQNRIVAQHPLPGSASARAAALAIEPLVPRGQIFSNAIVTHPDPATKSVHLRGDLQDAVRQLAETFGLQTTFDESVGHQDLRFDVENTTYAVAASLLFAMAHVFAVPIDEKTVLIAKDTADNRQRLERQVQETIYVPAQTVEQLNDLANVLRNLFDVKQLTVQQNLSSVVLRAPADTIEAINITLADLLDGGAEVILELKLYSVDISKNRDIGFQPPQFGAYNVTAAAQAIVSANQAIVNQAIAQGLIGPTDSVVAIAIKLIASGLVQSTLLSSTIGIIGGTIDPTTGVVSNAFTTTGITTSSTLTFNLGLNASDSRALEDVQLRVGDRQTADFRAGMRYPITTSTYSTPSASSLAGVNVNGSSAASLLSQYLGTNGTTTIPQISYEDLGLTFKATPTVQKSGRVSMHLDLKLESLAGEALNNIPILGSRTLTSDVTVNEGETALLVSTVSKSEASAVTGLPGLSELPGFQVPTEQNGTRSTSELVLLITPHVVRHRASNLAGPRIAVSVPPSARLE